jgi:hypothetical protein
MPCLRQELLALLDQPANPTHFMVGESKIPGKLNRLQPRLGDLPIAFHVDMHRLASIRAEEQEPVGTNRKNRWHPK